MRVEAETPNASAISALERDCLLIVAIKFCFKVCILLPMLPNGKRIAKVEEIQGKMKENLSKKQKKMQFIPDMLAYIKYSNVVISDSEHQSSIRMKISEPFFGDLKMQMKKILLHLVW